MTLLNGAQNFQPDRWEEFLPVLQDALDHVGGVQSVEEILDALQHPNAHFWAWKKSFLIVELQPDLKRPTIRVLLGGGDLDELVNVARPDAERWGKEHGFQRFDVIGRTGWAKVLGPVGYKAKAIILAKELDHV
jgi:hypothetical protein